MASPSEGDASSLDASLVLSVFVIACRSIAKALLVVGAGVLLTRRGALTPEVRKGLSVMSAGLLVPCLLLERFARTVTPALLSEAWPIIPVGLIYVALGTGLGMLVANPCWTPRELRAPTIAATAFANSQACSLRTDQFPLALPTPPTPTLNPCPQALPIILIEVIGPELFGADAAALGVTYVRLYLVAILQKSSSSSL